MNASYIVLQQLATAMPHNLGMVTTLRQAEYRQQSFGRASVECSSNEHGMGVTLVNGEETLHIQIAADATDSEVLRLGYAVLSFALREAVPGHRVLDLIGDYVYDRDTGEVRYL